MEFVSTNWKRYFLYGIIFCLLAVIIGAFGAHGLKSVTHDEKLLTSFETGVRYQMYHGLALLLIPFVLEKIQSNSKTILRLMIAGVLAFSFSIYLLVFAKISHFPMIAKIMGPITPIGGVLLILGWMILLLQLVKFKQK